jgi:hypothetical protein
MKNASTTGTKKLAAAFIPANTTTKHAAVSKSRKPRSCPGFNPPTSLSLFNSLIRNPPSTHAINLTIKNPATYPAHLLPHKF